MCPVIPLEISDEVASALDRGDPVVALESTVIAHGLPHPRNLTTALEMEALVRSAGAVPATSAILEGVARIGLSPAELTRVAQEEGVEKLSTRDLPVAVARRSNGATTVAATAFLAHRAGIRVFATGGIGGVHRGTPLDVSADLTELARTEILVVCAGAKSILDLPATREMLETIGVLVLGWRTDRFPAFYAAS
ncbi:MAG TPA: pseudouridine-5'-phosphate glycosidase, partial [Longimicrobiaceae bacterium]|nr:pseudouridine-5'-phosphate glycosidase [Longimicrobiaceae bacterium]